MKGNERKKEGRRKLIRRKKNGYSDIGGMANMRRKRKSGKNGKKERRKQR